MNTPFSMSSKRATSDVIVELSRDQIPPTLPFELKDHVSPNTWEIRVSTLARLASQYCQPSLERAFVVVILLSSFLVPITTYYVAVQAFEGTNHDVDKQAWLARFSCFAATVGTWIVLSVPLVLWKHIGRVRVARLVDQWTREDALAAPSYESAPVWKASSPGLFRDAIVLRVTVPSTMKSHFDRNSYLPPYISAGDGALPPYRDSGVARWSTDVKGEVKYGDIPIYTDYDKPTVAQEWDKRV